MLKKESILKYCVFSRKANGYFVPEKYYLQLKNKKLI